MKRLLRIIRVLLAINTTLAIAFIIMYFIPEIDFTIDAYYILQLIVNIWVIIIWIHLDKE